MKIQHLLEGQVKIPHETFKDAMASVSSDMFSRIFAYLSRPEAEEYEDNISKYMELVAKYKRMYGDFDLFPNHTPDKETVSKVYIRMPEVDPRYLKQNPNAKHRTYAIELTVRASDSNDAPSGNYFRKEVGKAARLHVIVPRWSFVAKIARSPELFESFMGRVRGVLHHELMHAVQDMALRQISAAPDYYNADEIDDDKYYLSDIEFSPLLTSSAEDFIAYIKELTATGHVLTAKNKADLFMNYVNPTASAPRAIGVYTPNFFVKLYRNDKAKWKKAVKIFHGLVDGKI